MWNILEFDELPSTNTLAAEMLAHGTGRHGDVIRARHQTAGRGRAVGRVWSDEPNASLLMSIVLTEIPPPAHLLQFRVALAVLTALRNESEHLPSTTIQLKWPNDILLNGKKVCGLLLEAGWNGDTMKSAIIGIGVNVAQQQFPPELFDTATSLAMQGVRIGVIGIRDAILSALERALQPASPQSLLERLRNEFAWMGTVPLLKWIQQDGTEIPGLRYRTLLDTGALELENDRGEITIVSTGSVIAL